MTVAMLVFVQNLQIIWSNAGSGWQFFAFWFRLRLVPRLGGSVGYFWMGFPACVSRAVEILCLH